MSAFLVMGNVSFAAQSLLPRSLSAEVSKLVGMGNDRVYVGEGKEVR